MTQNPRRIEDLADELISDILSFLLGAEHLSNTSSPINPHELPSGLNGRPAHVYGEGSEIDRFRLVCKRFLRISTPRKFPRFVLRFSQRGFQRLEDLLHMQLACHVKFFTYMVRPFYQGSGWSQFLDEADPNILPTVQVHRARLQDQTCILDNNHDRELLQKAILAFSSLQQVKLLRLQDEADERLLDQIHERPLERKLSLDWEPACARAVANLGISLLASNCTSVRFVGPQISPEATVRLLQTPSATLSALGARLTCLDVTFHSPADLTGHMEVLSGVFRDFFHAAKNLTTIHLGFATTIPLDLPLEQIFHLIQWKRLRTLSIQGWRLTSEEIVALLRRHRRQLRDIRLVSIFLRDGSRWRDVLSVLHDEMDEVERIDLREINYARHIDTPSTPNGSNAHAHGHGIGNGHGNGHGSGSAGFHHLPLSIIVNHNNSSNSPSPPSPPPSFHQAVLNTDLLTFASRGYTRGSFSPSTLDALRTLSADGLGDDGISVSQEQRQFWEAWVLSSPRKISPRWS
ncbi:F-box domain protein [Aspergillus lucknowensis]|uniref:F-box domain protein n=1 Tax=Aspergillus lucknowensis TaxID=176173 RepID=A0ABR4M0J2_9EURO